MTERAWDGTHERRREERKTVYEQLGELRVRVTHIEESISKIDHISEQMDTLLKQGQGIANLAKVLFYVVGPITALIYWVKDHVKL
jgi:hypothetical protein